MRKLTQEGYLELIDEGKLFINQKNGLNRKNQTWKIVDRKALPGRLKKNKKPGKIRDRMWKAMRIKRIFLLKDIMKLADVKEATAMNYIKILERNKYARKVGQRGQREGCHWQLVQDDGPERPVLKECPEVNDDWNRVETPQAKPSAKRCEASQRGNRIFRRDFEPL